MPLVLTWLKLKYSASAKIDTERMKIMEPGMLDYGTLLPQQLIIYLICLAYSVLCPIISFIGMVYFAIG